MNPPGGAIAPLNASWPVIGGMNPPAGAIALLNASWPVIGGMNPPAGAIAPLNAFGIVDSAVRACYPTGSFERGHSSAGRALEWHSRGRRFDPAWLHHKNKDPPIIKLGSVLDLRLAQRSPPQPRDRAAKNPRHLPPELRGSCWPDVKHHRHQRQRPVRHPAPPPIVPFKWFGPESVAVVPEPSLRCQSPIVLVSELNEDADGVKFEE